MTTDEELIKQQQFQQKWNEAFASVLGQHTLTPQMEAWEKAFQEVIAQQNKKVQSQTNMDAWVAAFQSVVNSWNVNPADTLVAVLQKTTPSLPIVQSPKNIAIQPTLNVFADKKKSDWPEIKRVLDDNGIKCFYHFTDTSNLNSIIQNGGLYSWYSCEKKGIKISRPGGSPDSRVLDTLNNLHDYVRLSFCDDHPMAFRHKQDGADLVLLRISLDVAFLQETLFSDINATANGHSVGGSAPDLKKLNFNAVKKHYVSRSDPNFAAHQAECMVKTVVPLKYILNIDCPDIM